MEEKYNKQLQDEHCSISFKEISTMLSFLEDMNSSDDFVDVDISSVKTATDTEGIGTMTCNSGEFKLWPLSLPSLERRSLDDASGHSLMTFEQIMASMNNYWPLHNSKSKGVALVRGGRVLVMNSSQYESIPQSELLQTVKDFLEANHKGKWEFKTGTYTHEGTNVLFTLKDSLPESYKSAWRNSGLSENLLNRTVITIELLTDDVSGSAAKLLMSINAGGTQFMLGDPVSVLHRKGSGTLADFKKQLDSLDMTIKEELEEMAKLMKITLLHPEGAAKRAIEKARLATISKKSCDDLTDELCFGPTETAYVVYMALHGILHTEHGERLSKDRQLRLIVALRSLLKEDWNKLDRA